MQTSDIVRVGKLLRLGYIKRSSSGPPQGGKEPTAQHGQGAVRDSPAQTQPCVKFHSSTAVTLCCLFMQLLGYLNIGSQGIWVLDSGED